MNPQRSLALEGRRRLKKILETHEEATGYLTDEVERRLRAQVGDGGTATADDTHPILAEILAEDVELGFSEEKLRSKTFLANVFCHRDHWINTRDYVKSRRPENHGRVIPIWRLDLSKLEDE